MFVLVFAPKARFVGVDEVDVPRDRVVSVAAVWVVLRARAEGSVGVGDAVHGAVRLDVVGRGAPVRLGELAARARADQLEVSGEVGAVAVDEVVEPHADSGVEVGVAGEVVVVVALVAVTVMLLTSGPLELRFDSFASGVDGVEVPFGGEEIGGAVAAAEAVARRLHRLEAFARVVSAFVLLTELAFERADLGRPIGRDGCGDGREVARGDEACEVAAELAGVDAVVDGEPVVTVTAERRSHLVVRVAGCGTPWVSGSGSCCSTR